MVPLSLSGKHVHKKIIKYHTIVDSTIIHAAKQILQANNIHFFANNILTKAYLQNTKLQAILQLKESHVSHMFFNNAI